MLLDYNKPFNIKDLFDIEMVIAWRWGFVLMQLKRA